jgi:hypothetical protein
MTKEQILEDLEFVRTLAHEGRAAPLLGGLHMVCWGSLVALAFAGHWATLYVIFPATGASWSIWAWWLAFGLIGWAMATLLGRRLRDKPGSTSVSNRGEQAAWGGASLMLAAIALGAIGHMIVTDDFTAANSIPPAAFAIYGGAMLATSFMSGEKLLRPFAFLAAAAGLALGVFADETWMYLAAAVAAFLTLVVPGALLLSREPKTTV